MIWLKIRGPLEGEGVEAGTLKYSSGFYHLTPHYHSCPKYLDIHKMTRIVLNIYKLISYFRFSDTGPGKKYKYQLGGVLTELIEDNLFSLSRF